MRSALIIVATGALLLGCRKSPDTPPKPPIVHVQPVEVVPFEDGYKAGFAAGEIAAKPRMPLPKEDDVQPLAHAEAVKDPDRDPKWERGYIEGYLDGFRNRTLGQK